MRALVTGGYGYIGGHLVHSLLRDGWDVTILDTMHTAKPWDFSQYTDKLSTISASVSNPDAVARAMHKVNVVYHLAARADWNNSPKHPMRILHTNIMGTATVLTQAMIAGADNVIVASSAAVYGNVVEAEELGPTDPVNVYGCSKLAAEAVCRAYCNLGMNIKVLRFFNVWGGKYSSSIISRMLSGGKVIYGDGTQTRDFVHVDDVVAALRAAYDWEPMLYNIGTGEEITINALWKLLRDDEPEYDERGPGYEEIEHSCADVAGTFGRVQWRPKHLLSELKREDIVRLCN